MSFSLFHSSIRDGLASARTTALKLLSSSIILKDPFRNLPHLLAVASSVQHFLLLNARILFRSLQLHTPRSPWMFTFTPNVNDKFPNLHVQPSFLSWTSDSVYETSPFWRPSGDQTLAETGFMFAPKPVHPRLLGSPCSEWHQHLASCQRAWESSSTLLSLSPLL